MSGRSCDVGEDWYCEQIVRICLKRWAGAIGCPLDTHIPYELETGSKNAA